MMPIREEMHRVLQERYGARLRVRFGVSRVAVCDLGGLGSNVAIALAQAGVDRLHLTNFDRVDSTNLNRRQYMVKQLGQCKTQAPVGTLRKITLHREILTDTVRAMEEGLPVLLEKDGIACEAFDQPKAKAMLVSGVLEHFPDKPLAAAPGAAGLGSANTIRIRRAFDCLYLCGDGVSSVPGVLGLASARVAVCAAYQAHMIPQLLAGETKP